jgi:hypothetical protein
MKKIFLILISLLACALAHGQGAVASTFSGNFSPPGALTAGAVGNSTTVPVITYGSNGVPTSYSNATIPTGSSPGGGNTDVQVASAGNFTGTANLTFNGSVLTTSANQSASSLVVAEFLSPNQTTSASGGTGAYQYFGVAASNYNLFTSAFHYIGAGSTANSWGIAAYGLGPQNYGINLSGNGTFWLGNSVNFLANGGTFSGNLTAYNYAGNTTGNAAPAGYIGELIVASNLTGNFTLTSGSTAIVCNVTLTPGDWDVTGWYEDTTTVTNISGQTFGLSSNTSNTQGNFTGGAGSSQPDAGPLPVAQWQVTTNTTVNLLANVIYVSGGGNISALIRARRVR